MICTTSFHARIILLSPQVVTSEILMASEIGNMQSCPIEVTKIPISQCDDNFDKECKGESTMPFYRSMYDTNTGKNPNSPREQVCIMTGVMGVISGPSIISQCFNPFNDKPMN